MRKSIVSRPTGPAPSPASGQWLDLAQIASVEISSEDAQHPLRMHFRADQGVAGGLPIRARK